MSKNQIIFSPSFDRSKSKVMLEDLQLDLNIHPLSGTAGITGTIDLINKAGWGLKDECRTKIEKLVELLASQPTCHKDASSIACAEIGKSPYFSMTNEGDTYHLVFNDLPVNPALGFFI